MKQTLTLCALLMFSMTAAAHHSGKDGPRHRPPPPTPLPHNHPHWHSDLGRHIEELFNLDRLQQAMIDDQVNRTANQQAQLDSHWEHIQFNRGIAFGNLQGLRELTDRVGRVEDGLVSLDARLGALEDHMSRAAHEFTKAIAAASALDFQAPTLSGTRLSFNVGTYGGYTSVGVGLATRFRKGGDPTLGFGIATVGGETLGRIQFGFDLRKLK